MRTLNLGILAHVDAGKTTLTERLLYEAGAIEKLGSVDQGTTQTDSLALERERGITIRAAVATMALDGLTVNILDTPGHPDFIAEVERVLSVLDGAVLVVSAVEGVQPQTPLLWRALERLGVPTIFFVNKIDRVGADPERTLAQLRSRLTPGVVALGYAIDPGTRDARVANAAGDGRARLLEQLAEHDDGLMDSFVDDRDVPAKQLWRVLARATAAARVQPVLYGSAAMGVGTSELVDAIGRLLPTSDVPEAATVAAAAALSARVFKVERSAAGAKAALARVFAGSMSVRERVRYGASAEGKVIELDVYEPGGPVQRQSAAAGNVVRVVGLDEIRVGDWIGEPLPGREDTTFPPPTLESVVAPLHGKDRARLRVALGHLADQDPLINVRQDADNVLSVALYGEVQKEVIETTLAREYGIAAAFRDTTTICIERPARIGEEEQLISSPTHSNISGRSSPMSMNQYAATLAMRIEPAAAGSGIALVVDVGVQLVPLYIYRTTEVFRDQLEQHVRAALAEGLYGWAVTDALVTVWDSGYFRTGSSAWDFKMLSAQVVRTALERAGSVVCEPYVQVSIELPEAYLSSVMGHIARMGARPAAAASAGVGYIRTDLPTAKLAELRRQLPGLSGGQGTMEAEFAGYQPVSGPPPTRKRWSHA